QAGLDKSKSAAFVVVNPDLVGIRLQDDQGQFQIPNRFLDLFVFVAPVSDRDAFATNFGLKKGVLKPNTLVSCNGRALRRYLYARGDHVYFGENSKAVLNVATGKRGGGELTPARRQTLARADVLLHLNAKILAPLAKRFFDDMEKELLKQTRK